MPELVGYTSGVYDLFHVGHVHRIRRAKELCDRLIVGVSTDECVSTFKSLPIIPFEQRIQIIGALRFVDLAVPQPHLDKYAMWSRLGFHLLIVGEEEDQRRHVRPYEEQLAQQGVRMVYQPRTPNVSTSQVIREVCERRCLTNRF